MGGEKFGETQLGESMNIQNESKPQEWRGTEGAKRGVWNLEERFKGRMGGA